MDDPVSRREEHFNEMDDMNTTTDEAMVLLAEYNTVTEAEISKSMLDSAGIWCTIRNEYMATLYPTGAMPAQLMVRPEELEQARSLLQMR